MQYSLALVSALFGATLVAATPDGCSSSFDGKFEISVDQVTTTKRGVPAKRDVCGSEGILVLTLEDGTLLDAQGRTGYIASNNQFQFDSPVQAGSLVDSGFSVCEGNILALGDSKTFYQCKSGTFYNLYNDDWAEQCEAVTIVAVSCGTEDTVSQGSDGQVIGTTVVQTTIVTALSDGQPQVITTTLPSTIYTTVVPVSEYSDGQVQVTPPGTGASSSPAVSTSSSPAVSTPYSSIPPATFPSATSVSIPATSAASSSSAGVSTTYANSTITTSAITSSSSAAGATSSTAAPTTSAPASGSSHVAVGSMGALVFGMLVAFVCL
ncbi:hypothetical protein GGR57DRAFT_501945 [Xylariaceae sp. FL1272]|nr:hypothetical protein GGR57DRAFT_501945 [Xylariaceae sp. FL1272]